MMRQNSGVAAVRWRATRWLMAGAAAGLLGGCGGGMRPVQEGPAVGNNPASLLQILASSGSPEVSRVQADEALAKSGTVNAARTAVLRKIVEDPGETATMRTYALQTLAESAPETCIEMLQQDLPTLEPAGIRAAACAECGRLNDLRLINPLVRALAAERPAEQLAGRPTALAQSAEAPALEKLGHAPLMAVLAQAVLNERDITARLAAVNVLVELNPERARDLITGVGQPDQFIADVQWAITLFNHLPTDLIAYQWVQELRTPHWRDTAETAAARNAELLGSNDYHFSFGAVGPLATLPPERLKAPLVQLADLCARANMQWDHANPGVGLTPPGFGMKDRIDLAVLATLADDLVKSGLVDSWRSAALALASQRTPFCGGLVGWNAGLRGTMYPTAEPSMDKTYTPSSQMVRDYPGALAAYAVYFDRPGGAAVPIGGTAGEAEIASGQARGAMRWIEVHVQGNGHVVLSYHSPRGNEVTWQP